MHTEHPEHKPVVMTLSEFQQISAALDPILRNVIQSEIKEPLEGLNTRVTGLEKWRWYVLGGFAVALFVFSLVVK